MEAGPRRSARAAHQLTEARRFSPARAPPPRPSLPLLQEERAALEAKYAKLYDPLLTRRKEVVTGKAEPTDEEVEAGPESGSAAAAAAAAAEGVVVENNEDGCVHLRTRAARSSGRVQCTHASTRPPQRAKSPRI